MITRTKARLSPPTVKYDWWIVIVMLLLFHTSLLLLFCLLTHSEPDPPSAMAQLHDITDHPDGWTQLVTSMLRVVPIDHPMGPSVIMLLLDDSPLPTKDAVLQVVDMITQTVRRTPQRERNLCVILGCLMEKMGGPSSVTLLSDTTLSYLIGNLDEGIHADVMLFSLIALEKFAQKTENKNTIQRKLAMLPENPLVRLERHYDADEFVLRQVGYCAKWSLDNYCECDNLWSGEFCYLCLIYIFDLYLYTSSYAGHTPVLLRNGGRVERECYAKHQRRVRVSENFAGRLGGTL